MGGSGGNVIRGEGETISPLSVRKEKYWNFDASYLSKSDQINPNLDLKVDFNIIDYNSLGKRLEYDRLCIFGRVKLVRQVQSSKHIPNFHEAENMSDLSMFWCFCIVVGCGMVHWCPRHSLDRGRGPLTNSSELRAWCPSSSNSTRAINQQIPGHYLCSLSWSWTIKRASGQMHQRQNKTADQYCPLLTTYLNVYQFI